MAERCVYAGAKAVPACEGRIQRHHAIGQQRLKARFPRGAYFDAVELVWLPVPPKLVEAAWQTRSRQEILDDPRIVTWACKRHHELETNGVIRLPIAARVWEFAREYGIEGMLENDMMRRRA